MVWGWSHFLGPLVPRILVLGHREFIIASSWDVKLHQAVVSKVIFVGVIMVFLVLADCDVLEVSCEIFKRYPKVTVMMIIFFKFNFFFGLWVPSRAVWIPMSVPVTVSLWVPQFDDGGWFAGVVLNLLSTDDRISMFRIE
jgi:hypothetical protein